MLQQKQLLGKFRLETTLVLETGLHIGGGGGNLVIGFLATGLSNPPISK
ncbi:MAG: type III-A CRISPR-associated RAMP protein Csm3, partial [Cyanobacteria bacterium J06636_27]